MTISFFDETDPISFEQIRLDQTELNPTVGLLQHGETGYIVSDDYFADKDGLVWVDSRAELITYEDPEHYERDADEFVRVIVVEQDGKKGVILDLSAHFVDLGINPDEFMEPAIDGDTSRCLPVVGIIKSEMQEYYLRQALKKQYGIDLARCALLEYFIEARKKSEE